MRTIFQQQKLDVETHTIIEKVLQYFENKKRIDMAEVYNFPDHLKNDTFLAQEFIYKRNGVAIDLTGATIAMMLRLVKDADPVALSLSSATSGITITDAVNGTWEVDEQVISIDAGTYFQDIQLTESSGRVSTFTAGTWNIIQDVTYT